MKFSRNRKTKRYACHQPIQMIVSQERCTHSNTVTDGVIRNATKQGFFIETPSKIKSGKIFFCYDDANSASTLYFDCDVLRTEASGIAVTYQLLSDQYQTQGNCLYSGNTAPVSKGRFLNRYL